MRSFIYFISALILFSTFTAQGEDAVKFNVQIRHRFEMDNKDFDSSTDYNSFNLLRTRLGATFHPAENLQAYIEAQDARLLGGEVSTLEDGNPDNFDLHQAYFKIEKLFKLPFDLQVGRMEINFGSQRLVGAYNWDNRGRSFDGARLTLNRPAFSIDFFSYKIHEELQPHNEYDLNFYGAYGDFKIHDTHTTQAYVLVQGATPSGDLTRVTMGVYARGIISSFHHDTEFAYQTGEIYGDDISALMGALHLGYTAYNRSSLPDLTIGVDYVSGDDDPGDGTYGAFDTMYASKHRYYGAMDYFTDLPTDTDHKGLIDLQARFTFIPIKKTKLTATYHRFHSGVEYPLSDGETATYFGSEVDVTILHKYSDNVSFALGGSEFFGGDIFDDTRGTDGSSWFFLMTTVRF